MSSDVEERIADMASEVESIYGSQRERAVAEQRGSNQAQSDMADCMADAGFSYPSVVFPLPDPSGAARINFKWWGPLDPDIASTAGYGGFTGINPPAPEPTIIGDEYANMDLQTRAAYDSRRADCSEDAFADQDAVFVRDADELINELDARVQAAIKQSSGGAQALADYGACVADQGYEFDRPSHIYSTEIEKIGNETGIFALGVESPEYSEALERAAEAERRVALADVTCRMAVITQIAEVMLPVYEAWIDDQQSEIDAVLAAWSDYRDTPP